MNKRLFRSILLLSILFVTAATSARAEEMAAAPAMDPAMMEKMKALMSPGAAHQVLEAFAGKWTYSGNFWMMPEAPAQAMTGTAENTMIYGGRFLKQEFSGPWMGENFEGLGYTGYDNIKQEYVTTWMDSMGTGIMIVNGQYDAAAKTLNQAGANSCPLTGETDRKGRSTWTVQDADHNTYTSYSVGPDGTEFKMMEINYTRAE